MADLVPRPHEERSKLIQLEPPFVLGVPGADRHGRGRPDPEVEPAVDGFGERQRHRWHRDDDAAAGAEDPSALDERGVGIGHVLEHLGDDDRVHRGRRDW